MTAPQLPCGPVSGRHVVSHSVGPLGSGPAHALDATQEWFLIRPPGSAPFDLRCPECVSRVRRLGPREWAVEHDPDCVQGWGAPDACEGTALAGLVGTPAITVNRGTDWPSLEELACCGPLPGLDHAQRCWGVVWIARRTPSNPPGSMLAHTLACTEPGWCAEDNEERCGQVSPGTELARKPSVCRLRPGHEGKHSGRFGEAWTDASDTNLPQRIPARIGDYDWVLETLLPWNLS